MSTQGFSSEPVELDDVALGGGANNGPNGEFEVEVGPHAPDPSAKPGPGGLKKKSGGGSKRGLLWRDLEDKGRISVTHLLCGNYHHVDSMPSSSRTQSVAMHEKSKKARQKEKEVNMTKMRESMKQSVAWVTPPLLSLPEAVNELVRLNATEMESEEKMRQGLRLKGVLEARYLDDSMIPPNPDDAPGGAAHVAEDPVPVSWFMDDDGDDEVYGGGEEAVAGGDEGDAVAALIKQLPAVLQQLPYDVLMQLVVDQAKMDSIMNSDGTLNHGKVALLRMQLITGASVSQAAPPAGAGVGNGSGGVSSRFSRADDRAPPNGSRQLSGQPYSTYGPPASHPSAGGGMTMAGVAINRTAGLPGARPMGMNRPNERPAPGQGKVPCKHFNSPSGFCPFGDRCTFAHAKTSRPAW